MTEVSGGIILGWAKHDTSSITAFSNYGTQIRQLHENSNHHIHNFQGENSRQILKMRDS